VLANVTSRGAERAGPIPGRHIAAGSEEATATGPTWSDGAGTYTRSLRTQQRAEAASRTACTVPAGLPAVLGHAPRGATNWSVIHP
jgi:hypothetical protein